MNGNDKPAARMGAKPLIRPARMCDVHAIHAMLNHFADRHLMLPRAVSSIYDHLRDFVVYEEGGEILGICALQICWENLAEIRSLAVLESRQRQGIGRRLVESCLDEARLLEINRVFTLTYQAPFFRTLGFVDTDKQNLPHKIWSDCLHCPKFPDCDEDALIWEGSSIKI